MAREFIGVRVENQNSFVRTMRKAGADMTDLKETNKAVANLVLPYALALTPVDNYDGGDLLATGRAAGTVREAIIRFGKKSVPYAGVTHYGYPSGGAKHQAANPWLAEAAKATEPQWVELYWAAVERTIDSVAKNY
jgi:hypothetical protein